MTFFIISFVAGILTVLAPCILPILPVIIGSSISDTRSRLKPFVITISLAISVILFTLVLKFATIFIDVSPTFWQYLSGGILVIFGLITLFPTLWEKLGIKWNLLIGRKSNTLLAEGVKKESFVGDIIIGASLGPVFSSCSPTYFVILATVLPQSFGKGLIYLIAYSVGLSLSLLLIAKLGQKLVGKLEGVSNPQGWFKRTLGALFLLVGIFIAFGFDKSIQTYLVNNASIFDITKIEQNYLLPKVLNEAKDTTHDTILEENGSRGIEAWDTITALQKGLKYPKYRELVSPSGFVNSDPFLLKDIIGKKVVLLDVMTYSCINCQRTFPYANAWYEKYKDEGLEIVAIHTPEFAFEKKKENVEEAMRKFGIKFPVVLDNDYGTWNAYGNNFWPRKYLIDIDGYVVYDHIGEGDYDETEEEIKEALRERLERMNIDSKITGNVSQTIKEQSTYAKSVETYFGAFRNGQFFGNGITGQIYEDAFTLPSSFVPNKFYLDGNWKIEKEYIEAGSNASFTFEYEAAKVHLVAEGVGMIEVNELGSNGSREIKLDGASLYTIVNSEARMKGQFYISVPKGVRLYALTFG